MNKVIPFRGILYNTQKVRGEDVACPPYDIISTEMRSALYDKSPFNIVRIDAGTDLPGDTDKENKYSRAKETFKKWLDDGILVRSEKPCFYAYRMEYEVRKRKVVLSGFFGLVRLDELGNGVYPHEDTHSKPKHDRLTLLGSTNANTSPIFSLYDSKERIASKIISKATAKPPYISATDNDGAIHSLWVIENEAEIKAVSDDLADKAIFIADGHHRYETALEFKKSHGSTADYSCDYVMMFLANIAEPGITVLPTHRLVNVSCDILAVLSDNFDFEEIDRNADILDAIEGKRQTFGLYVNGRLFVLKYTGGGLEDINPVLRGLDVVILHQMVFDRLLNVSKTAYEMDVEKARAEVDSKNFTATFFLNPTSVTDVESVALSELRMPPKSTYFYPKVMTGFTINGFKNSK